MARITIICEICGETVPRTGPAQKYCPACAEIVKADEAAMKKKNEAAKAARKNVKRRKPKGPDPAAIAKALGMTYGMYVAIRDGFLPGREELEKRERELLGSKQQTEGGGW